MPMGALSWAKHSGSIRHQEEIMVTRYDAIVIGTGQSGPPLAARLADEGMKVAVIERKKFGGTCVNVGCVPTKTWWRARAPPTSPAAPPISA